MVARLTYRFQPKAELQESPRNTADYEYILLGAQTQTMRSARGFAACCHSI
jgi:putative ATP-dependent endonuclease of the OLD family